jgi:hypothetical protein
MNFLVTDKSVDLKDWTVTLKVIPDGVPEKLRVKALMELFSTDTETAGQASAYLKTGGNPIAAVGSTIEVDSAIAALETEPSGKMVKVIPSENNISVRLTTKNPGLLSMYKLPKKCFEELRILIKAVYTLLVGGLEKFPADLECPVRNAVALVTGVGSQRKSTHWTTWSQGGWPPGV